MNEHLARTVEVAGQAVRWDEAGTGRIDVVLIHGNGAHHMWWHRIAPELEERYRVIRLDLTGHGDSGRHPAYSPEIWMADVLAVLDAARAQRPIVVGHSMGARLTVALAAEHPDRVGGAILLDASIRPPSRYREFVLGSRRVRRYETLDDGVRAFKLLPPQPEPSAEELLPVARNSLRQDAEGWTWKFDQIALRQFQDLWVDGWAGRVRCPVGYVYGGRSVVVNDALAEYAVSRFRGVVRTVRLDDAYHHLILDHPEESTKVILELLAWQQDLLERHQRL